MFLTKANPIRKVSMKGKFVDEVLLGSCYRWAMMIFLKFSIFFLFWNFSLCSFADSFCTLFFGKIKIKGEEDNEVDVELWCQIWRRSEEKLGFLVDNWGFMREIRFWYKEIWFEPQIQANHIPTLTLIGRGKIQELQITWFRNKFF